jgi:tetratricopeptide (TPR) repeat protein
VSPAAVLALLLLPAAAAQSGDVLRDATAAYRAGDMPGAIRLYRQFLAEHPSAAEIRSNLGAALAGNGQFADAIQEYQTALKDLPNNPRVRMNLALAYYKLGRLPEAVRTLEALHEVQALELKPALLLADCLLQTAEPQKAVTLLQPLLEEYPEDRAVIYMLATAMLNQGLPRNAQAMLDRLLQQGESAETEYLLGQQEYMNQNPLAASKHLARAIKIKPDLPGAHSLYGQVLRTLGQLDEASAQFRKELSVNAYDFLANTETAMLLKQEGKPEEALALIARALQIRPKDPGALYQRASIHLMQGHTEQAREEFEQVVADNPSFAEAHAALATAYYRLKRTVDGDRERELARRGQPRK